MRTNSRIYRTVFAAFFSALVALPFALASEGPAASPGMAVMTVTAIGKKDAAPAAINKDDIQLNVGKERKQIASWEKGGKLDLAILIDDSLDPSAASQWDDVRTFINAQPKTTSIAVGYADNSTVFVAQDFTSDHALAAKALRIPRGYYSGGSSPYLSVIDWLKRWPKSGNRGSLLLISSGIDYFRGGFGPVYPDVDTAISHAQKANVNLWNIYYPGSGHFARSMFLVDKGQLNLSKMTLETGGESFYLGVAAPVSLKPYLDEMDRHLSNQYLLSFAGDTAKKGKYATAHVKTELPDVELLYANQAYVQPSQ